MSRMQINEGSTFDTRVSATLEPPKRGTGRVKSFIFTRRLTLLHLTAFFFLFLSFNGRYIFEAFLTFVLLYLR